MGTNEKIFVLGPWRLPQLSGHKACAYPRQKKYLKSGFSLLRQRWEDQAVAQERGVSVLSREERGCFLRKNLVSQGIQGLSQLPQGRASWSLVLTSQQDPPTAGLFLKQVQSGWEGQKEQAPPSLLTPFST